MAHTTTEQRDKEKSVSDKNGNNGLPKGDNDGDSDVGIAHQHHDLI